MRKVKTFLFMTAALLGLPGLQAGAQQILSLDQCRDMAVSSNRDMQAAEVKIEMARMDKKIAFANWFPNISVTGTYMFNEKGISLVDDDLSDRLKNSGTLAQDAMGGIMGQLQNAIMSNPAAMQEFLHSPMWQAVASTLTHADMAGLIGQLGNEIDGILHPDLHNVVLGVASLKQPIFMGGKIAAANQIAKMAEELSHTQYDQQYQEILVSVDQSYWQIVSIANKLNLATSYADLIAKLENDVQVSIDAGVMTRSDLLQIQVKKNEADMMKLKAENGLSLAKMLLCKQIGIDLDSDIMLLDENLEDIPIPDVLAQKDLESICEDRPEMKSLQLATDIYRKKVNVVRADMMPHLALTANYLMTYPNVFKGFSNSVGGTFNVGVMLNIPIFHAMELNSKTRKAKAEATLYQIRMEDARNMIHLQVTQLRKQRDETLQKLNLARNNMENAEENLRTASVGFEAGVVPTNTALSAHTAWLQAHSEYIDAGVELQMNNTQLMKAEGNYKRPEK